MNDEAIEKLEALLEKWRQQAFLLRRIYGDSEPAAGVFNECWGDLWVAIQDARAANPTTALQGESDV